LEIRTGTDSIQPLQRFASPAERPASVADRFTSEDTSSDSGVSMDRELRKMAMCRRAESAGNCGISAQMDGEYTNAFHRRTGWTGADGTYSVPLSDGRTLWLFGDTLIDSVLPSGAHSGKTLMINNSIALQKGSDPSTARFITGGTDSNAASFFVPPDGKGWFWIHDAVPDCGDGKILVFLDQIEKSGEGVFGFRQTGTWTAEVEVKDGDVSIKRYGKLPHFREGKDGAPTTAFGASILTLGDWTYIYGTQDYGARKDLIVARKPSGKESDDNTCWQFFTGEGWSSRMDDMRPICNDVGNELSVHRTEKGTFVLTSQKAGFDAEIYLKTAPAPTGPWSAPQTVWTAPESSNSILTYNAKAHPELSDRQKGLLISYNVNATTSEAIMEDADIYRPRFIRVKGALTGFE